MVAGIRYCFLTCVTCRGDTYHIHVHYSSCSTFWNTLKTYGPSNDPWGILLHATISPFYSFFLAVQYYAWEQGNARHSYHAYGPHPSFTTKSLVPCTSPTSHFDPMALMWPGERFTKKVMSDFPHYLCFTNSQGQRSKIFFWVCGTQIRSKMNPRRTFWISTTDCVFLATTDRPIDGPMTLMGVNIMGRKSSLWPVPLRSMFPEAKNCKIEISKRESNLYRSLHWEQ